MKIEPTTAEELMVRIASGDTKAIGELYDRYAPRLLALTLRILGDRGAAEEAVESVFTRVWSQARHYPGNGASVAAWLEVIARREAVDRRRSARKLSPLFPGTSNFHNRVLAWLPRSQDVVALEKKHSLVAKLLSQLPQPQRGVLELAFLEGLTEEEIAHQLGEPLAKVRASLRAATAFLRHRLRVVLGIWTANF